MTNLPELRLKPQILERYQLPDIGYPIPSVQLQQIISSGGELPLALMLHGLQQLSQDGKTDWLQSEPAMDRLAHLITQDDQCEPVIASGDNWWLEISAVDLNGKLVTIQRGNQLIAAISPREDGRLRVAVFRPLDAKSIRYLTGLSINPHPEYGVSMRENNWEYTLDASAGMGNAYADHADEAYLSYWEKGLGISWDNAHIPEWRSQLQAQARYPALVATEIHVHCTMSNNHATEDTDEEPVNNMDMTKIPRWQSKRQQQRTVRNRFLGCLLGGAVGDALGAPVEFMSRSEILRQFGGRGVTDYAPAYGGLGKITDDTQMTLFTAEGLLRGWVRNCLL